MKSVRFSSESKSFDGEADNIYYSKKLVKYYLNNISYLLKNKTIIRKIIPNKKMRFMVYLKLSEIKKKKLKNKKIKNNRFTKRLFTTHISKDPLYIHSNRELELLIEVIMKVIREDIQLLL